MAAGFALDHQSLGGDDLDIGDANESQHMLQPGRCEVNRAADLGAAGSDQKIGFLAGQQALRTIFGVTKRDAGARDLVNPRLQRRRHAEVVNRHADDQNVGGPHLLHQRVRQRQRSLFVGVARGRIGEVCRHPVAVDELHAGGQIATGDLNLLPLGQALNEQVGELAGD